MQNGELRDRIVIIFRAHTGATSDRGACSWFARKADVNPWTVTRWLTGRRPFRGPPLALLEALEAQVSKRR